MGKEQLELSLQAALEYCCKSRERFNFFLSVLARFKGQSLNNVLLLSSYLQTLDIDLKTSQEISDLGYSPDTAYSYELFDDMGDSRYYYDLCKISGKKPISDEEQYPEEIAAWLSKTEDLFLRFRKGTSEFPSLFSGFKWKRTDKEAAAYITKTSDHSDFEVFAKKNDIRGTFYEMIKTCVHGLFDRNRGFNSFSDTIKDELAGYIATMFLREQNLAGTDCVELPCEYLKEYRSDDDFRSYLILIQETFRMISPDALDLAVSNEKPASQSETAASGSGSDSGDDLPPIEITEPLPLSVATESSSGGGDSGGFDLSVPESDDSIFMDDNDPGTFALESGEDPLKGMI